MSKSRISQSLMKSINGGKEDTDGGDPFAKAKINDEDKPESSADTGPNVHLDEQPVPVEIPVKVKPKRGGAAGIAAGISVVLAIGGVALGGYGIQEVQLVKQSQLEASSSVDAALGGLTSKTDDLLVDLKQTRGEVAANAESLATLPAIRESIAGVQSRLSGLSADIDQLRPELESLKKELNGNSGEIETLEKKVKELTEKPRVIQRVVKEPAVSEKRQEQLLAGASIASIDVWGDQSSVVMQSADGRWVPLSIGDAFNGWRLYDVKGSSAVFKRGDKIKKVAVTE